MALGSKVEVHVKPGYAIEISSSAHSAGDERFTIHRKLYENSQEYKMDDLQAGARVIYSAWNQVVIYIFDFRCYWAHKSYDGWKPARAYDTKLTNQGDTVTIFTENHWSNDNDFNDCIVNARTYRSPVVLDVNDQDAFSKVR